jgi:anti-sigma factor RsiW
MSRHVHESLGSYLLGGLDPDEAAAVRAHLARCPTCAAEHASLAKLPALLDLAGAVDATGHAPLAPVVEERVLDRFARERPPAGARRWRRPRSNASLASQVAIRRSNTISLPDGGAHVTTTFLGCSPS